jgi:hypothetical protein
MTGIFNIFDFIVIIVIILWNYFMYTRSSIRYKLFIVIAILVLFSVVLPYMSTQIELTLVRTIHDADSIDGFNLVYIWLKWPTYWLIGILELIYLYSTRARGGEGPDDPGAQVDR